MDKIRNTSNIYFQSRFESTKALKEVNEYAQNLGYPNFVKEINKELKYRKNYIFHLKHNYSKTQKLCKTEIKYEKNSTPYKYIKMDSKLTNPVELSFEILQNLRNTNSKIFKDIFQ